MELNEFLEKNKDILGSISSVTDCTEKAAELAGKQGCEEAMDAYNNYLLSSKLCGFFGWCNATPESVEKSIEKIGDAVRHVPNYGYKPSLNDFVTQVSHTLDYNDMVTSNLPLAVFRDICKHYY